jgi:lipoprotein signal peptidase
MANYYLPFNEDLYILGDKVSLYLTYNQGATGGQADYLLAAEANSKNLTVLLTCFNGLVLLAYVLFIRKRQIRIIYKVLIGIVFLLVLSIRTDIILPLLGEIIITSWTTSVVGKITGLIIYGSLFYLSKNKWIRYFTLIMLACGVGNLMSHFYVPYRVIDFINIEGSYELLRIGVFNFADLAFDIGAIGLVISTIVLSVSHIYSGQTTHTTENK